MKGRAWLRLTSAASTRSPCRTSRRGSRAAAFRATASPLRQHLRRWRREQRRCPTGTTPTQCLRGEGGNRAACFVCTRARAHTHRVYPQFGNLSGLTVIHWGGLRVDRAQFDMRAIQNDTWVRCARLFVTDFRNYVGGIVARGAGAQYVSWWASDLYTGGGSAVASNQWYHLLTTWDRVTSTRLFYVNGTQVRAPVRPMDGVCACLGL